jgi:hypothetical protein
METAALTSRFFFRPRTLGEITIDSQLTPTEVIENLRTVEGELRESGVPEDLRKFNVRNLALEVTELYFEMRWIGSISPFYNPVCHGSVDRTPTGSRIRIAFGLNRGDVSIMAILVLGVTLPFLTGGSKLKWVFLAVMLVILAYGAFHNRSAEPMRARLIEIVSRAASPGAIK